LHIWKVIANTYFKTACQEILLVQADLYECHKDLMATKKEDVKIMLRQQQSIAAGILIKRHPERQINDREVAVKLYVKMRQLDR
jgi:hypothetical protein